jgi:hypothetical protein
VVFGEVFHAGRRAPLPPLNGRGVERQRGGFLRLSEHYGVVPLAGALLAQGLHEVAAAPSLREGGENPRLILPWDIYHDAITKVMPWPRQQGRRAWLSSGRCAGC